jgi:RES domain-containing protein
MRDECTIRGKSLLPTYPVRPRRRSRNTGKAPASPHRPTLAAYKITLAEVADLSQGFDPTGWDKAWIDWDCAWRQIARIDKKVPPSWMLADRVITAGLGGILFPSLRHAGGTNLVIFPANLVDGDHVTVHDPEHRLPQDQSSWP